jgi:hypothetical protein
MSIVVVAFVALFLFLNAQSGLLAITGQTGDNIVLNPSFENINPTTNYPLNWTFASTDTTHTVSVDGTQAHTGSKSLKMTVANTTQSWYGWNMDKIPAKGNTNYQLEFWYKGDGLAGNSTSNHIGLTISFLNSSGVRETRWFDYYPSWSASSFGWTHAIVNFKTNPTTVNFGVGTRLYATSGSAWFDDISIKELKEDANLYIANPSFELWTDTYADTRSTASSNSNTANGWYAGQGGAIIERSTDAEDGSYSMKLSVTGATCNPTISSACAWNHTYVGQDANYLVAGHKYEMSAYIKSAEKITMQAQVTNWTLGGSFGMTTSTGGNTWQKITSTFVPTKVTTYRIVLGQEYMKTGTVFLVDNVDIKDLGLATVCTTLSQCGGTESCTNGYCMAMSCVSGYHAENHLCVINPINCNDGFYYNSTTTSCQPSPVAGMSMGWIIGLIAGAVLLVIIIVVVVRRK